MTRAKAPRVWHLLGDVALPGFLTSRGSWASQWATLEISPSLRLRLRLYKTWQGSEGSLFLKKYGDYGEAYDEHSDSRFDF